MATTSKKTTTKEEKKVSTKAVENVDEEKEELKNKLKELEEKLAKLSEQSTSASNNISANQIISKRNIKIVNLTRGEMYLRGSRIHKFDKQFDSRVFTEGEVRQIYANMPKTLTEGYVYIVDKNMVEELELTDAYSSLLDAKTLKMLLEKNPSEVVEIYKNANEVQKNTIIGMIEDKKLSGDYVDANVVIELGKLCGKDLMKIEPLTE